MDWVRLASGKILAKARMSVDHEELMKHNKQDDCWVHIFGQVYDVTSYLGFHPGGVPELMRAAGTDATDLFNQYHAWVNYENMLKSCLVGRFTGELSKLPQPGPPTTEQPQSISAQLNALIMKGKQKDEAEAYGISIVKDGRMLKVSSDKWHASNLHLYNVIVDVCRSKSRIRLVVRAAGQSVFEVKWDDVALNDESCVYEVLVRDGTILITFESLDVTVALASANRSIRQSPLLAYHECVVEEKRQISHDTLLFNLRLPDGLYFPVAVGRHVSFRIRKGASKLYRPYTPVTCGSLPDDSEEHDGAVCKGATAITFLIKVYEDGICTPTLGALNVGKL
ncbi:cytochrome b5-like Heme/Steroid binding domain protein [Cooperia oncophora]